MGKILYKRKKLFIRFFIILTKSIGWVSQRLFFVDKKVEIPQKSKKYFIKSQADLSLRFFLSEVSMCFNFEVFDKELDT